MKWFNEKTKWVTYAFDGDKAITIEVMPDGHYIGMVTNNKTDCAISGASSSVEEAKAYIESIYDVKQAEEVKPIVVAKPVVETEPEEVVESVVAEPVVINAGDDLLASYVKENGLVQVTLNYVPSRDAVIKYTTNGNKVSSHSKIYTEPFVLEKGGILNASAFLDKDVVYEVSDIDIQ